MAADKEAVGSPRVDIFGDGPKQHTRNLVMLTVELTNVKQNQAMPQSHNIGLHNYTYGR